MTRELDLEGLQRVLWWFAGHRVLTVSARTGVLRLLAERSATTDEAARELGLDPLAAGKVIRALTALGVLRADGERYRVVDALAPSFHDGPEGVLPFFEHSHSMYDGWGANLETWLRGNEWTTRARTPEETERFGRAMRAMGTQTARRAAAELDLAGVERMLDVGGGFGHFARVLCDQRPSLQATVFDIPEVVDMARGELEASGFEDRISFVGGDYLDSDYGSGYDLVLFANVLHQESPQDAAEMVRRGVAALAPRGRAVVLDFAIDDAQHEHLLGALFAINMRSFGDTHTEPTIRSWMEAAGLDNIERRNLGSDRWIITGRKMS